MRIATLQHGEQPGLAIVEGEFAWFIRDLNMALPTDLRIPESATDFIELYHTDRQRIARAVEAARRTTGIKPIPTSAAAFAPPVPSARKLLCVAGNYAEHIVEGGGSAPRPEESLPPRVFMKPPSTTMIGSGAPIVMPPYARAIDWELELGVVIGRPACDILPQEARDYIFGYTIVNDVSERKFDPGPRTTSRPGDEWFDWLNGKWHDTFAPIGPVVVTADEIPNPQALSMRLEVNGQVEQEASTGQMLHDVFSLVSFFSRILTLEVGDIIATGTPAGVGMAKGRFLKPGDVVRATIEGIGTLINPVVAHPGGKDDQQ